MLALITCMCSHVEGPAQTQTASCLHWKYSVLANRETAVVDQWNGKFSGFYIALFEPLQPPLYITSCIHSLAAEATTSAWIVNPFTRMTTRILRHVDYRSWIQTADVPVDGLNLWVTATLEAPNDKCRLGCIPFESKQGTSTYLHFRSERTSIVLSMQV